MYVDASLLDELFAALGDYLSRSDAPATLVVVGGASLAALGIVERTTNDVDVIARAVRTEGHVVLEKATPFSDELQDAVTRVARDFSLPDNWLNAVVGKQWGAGLPPNLTEEIDWRQYSALTVGFVGRPGLISLKLFAAVDQGPASKHWQDLLALRPSENEIEIATNWVRGQDASPDFQNFVDDATERLRRDLAAR